MEEVEATEPGGEVEVSPPPSGWCSSQSRRVSETELYMTTNYKKLDTPPFSRARDRGWWRTSTSTFSTFSTSTVFEPIATPADPHPHHPATEPR